MSLRSSGESLTSQNRVKRGEYKRRSSAISVLPSSRSTVRLLSTKNACSSHFRFTNVFRAAADTNRRKGQRRFHSRNLWESANAGRMQRNNRSQEEWKKFSAGSPAVTEPGQYSQLGTLDCGSRCSFRYCRPFLDVNVDHCTYGDRYAGIYDFQVTLDMGSLECDSLGGNCWRYGIILISEETLLSGFLF